MNGFPPPRIFASRLGGAVCLVIHKTVVFRVWPKLATLQWQSDRNKDQLFTQKWIKIVVKFIKS
jgi:hypothetical protein